MVNKQQTLGVLGMSKLSFAQNRGVKFCVKP